MLLLLLIYFFGGVAGNDVVKITSVDEFKNFVSKVNSGTNYSGTTILLDSDITLTVSIGPIGLNTNYQFCGVFDGQGHTISNLKISTSSQHAGLFGYSKGLTIKNVVLDSSCSITNTLRDSERVYAGGIIGYCYAGSGQYNIENNVNMASITFGGNIGYYTLYLGGIVGYLRSSSRYPSYMKNCVNYGSVTHSGTSSNSYIGGIAGYLGGYNPNYAYIQNAINHGTITHSGTTSYLCIGGIVGSSYYAYIENSVSSGSISMQTTPSDRYIRSIVGYDSSDTYINYCYYTSDLSDYDLYGTGTPESESYVLSYDSTTFMLNGTVSVGSYTGTSLIGALNAAADYYILRDYSKWLLNKNSKTVTFTINSRTSPITMNSQVILLPSLADEGSTFFGRWYNDSECTNPLSSFEITGDTRLYGKSEEDTKNYTITFDSRREGVSVASITAQFGDTVSLPSESIREHCSVAFWETGYGDNMGLSLTMPAHNFVLYAVWKCTHITRIDDFIDFSKVVNSGVSYSGTTVLLDSDLSLSGKTLGSIGKGYPNYFCGIFDGQGHIISNLKMSSSSSYYAGLFGLSRGLTIKNVVLDSSCSITNSFTGNTNVRVGGFIGVCSGGCNIENSVNMAGITFSGNISKYSNTLYLGGIAGYLDSSYRYPSYLKNCVNYGSVTDSGVSRYSYIGGIAGYLEGYNPNCIYIQNTLNYGTITHSGTTTNTLRIGGIVGYIRYAYIENCVSAGSISMQTTATTRYIGIIAGHVSSGTYINYCYYTNDVGVNKLYGAGAPSSSSYTLSYDNITFELSGTVSVGSYTGTSLIGALNAAADYYYLLRDYSKWLHNKNTKSVNFTINSRTSPITMNSKVILLPSLADEGNISFGGWYTDNNCANPLSSFEITKDTALHGLYGMLVVVTFDINGGDNISHTSKKVSLNTTYGTLPTPEREGYIFVGWFTEKERKNKIGPEDRVINLNNHTLYAQWTINNYTLIFDFGNGADPEVRILNFNSSIAYPSSPEREGHTFNGWNKSDVKFMPSSDLTITAQWTINTYTLTFDFDNGSNPEVREVEYNSSIKYPNHTNKKGYILSGWTENITTMPNHNLTIKALWIESHSSHSSSSSTSSILAVCVVVPVIIIIIVVILILALKSKRRENYFRERMLEMDKPLIDKDVLSSEYRRVVAATEDEVEGTAPVKASKLVLSRLYTKDYVRPTMRDALSEVGLRGKQVEIVCSACENVTRIVTEESRLSEGFTTDDAEAIAMYTYDFGPKEFESNPYRIINRSLAERNYAGLQKASGLLYLVMTALRKLPRATGMTLYRGVRSVVNLDKDHYYKGNIMTWSALSSTSPDAEATKAFLAKGTKNRKASGTLFIIEGGWGYNIQPYSLFPGEEEILLEPERQFEVVSVAPFPDITIINLKMLDTPLVLPEIFGGQW